MSKYKQIVCMGMQLGNIAVHMYKAILFDNVEVWQR